MRSTWPSPTEIKGAQRFCMPITARSSRRGVSGRTCAVGVCWPRSAPWATVTTTPPWSRSGAGCRSSCSTPANGRRPLSWRRPSPITSTTSTTSNAVTATSVTSAPQSSKHSGRPPIRSLSSHNHGSKRRRQIKLVFESRGPRCRTGRDDEQMAGRKRHSAEDIVRKLRRADELAAEGKTGEEIAAELGVSPATLYNWWRTYGGMDTDAAKELKELREQNARLKRLLAEAELVKDALREVAKENSEPGCQAPRRGHAHDHVEHVGAVGVQGGWAGPLHPPTPAGGADTRRSRRAFAGLAARVCRPNTRATGFGVPGRRCV